MQALGHEANLALPLKLAILIDLNEMKSTEKVLKYLLFCQKGNQDTDCVENNV